MKSFKLPEFHININVYIFLENIYHWTPCSYVLALAKLRNYITLFAQLFALVVDILKGNCLNCISENHVFHYNVSKSAEVLLHYSSLLTVV